MTEESGSGSVSAGSKGSPLPKILLLLFLVGGVASAVFFGLKHVPGGGSASVESDLPVDTKFAINIAGLANLYDQLGVWMPEGQSLADALFMISEGRIAPENTDKLISYCKATPGGDCRVVLASTAWGKESEDPAAIANSLVIMVEGLTHKALFEAFAAAGGSDELKIEELDGGIRKASSPGSGMEGYLVTRGSFLAFTPSLETAKALQAQDGKKHTFRGSGWTRGQWDEAMIGTFVDFTQFRQDRKEDWAEMKNNILNPAADEDLPEETKKLQKDMKGLFTKFIEIAEVTDILGGTFSLTKEGLRLSFIGDFDDSSTFGKSVASTKAEPSKVLPRLAVGRGIYFGISRNVLSQLNLQELQKQLIKKVFNDGLKDEHLDAMLSEFKDAATATSWMFGEGMRQSGVYEYDKPKETLKLMLDGFEQMSKSNQYEQLGMGMAVSRDVAEHQGIKFSKVTTTIGKDLMGTQDPTANMVVGMLVGNGEINQWMGADDKYVYMVTASQFEGAASELDIILAGGDKTIGSTEPFKKAIASVNKNNLAIGLLDLQSLVGPMLSIFMPGLFDETEEKSYAVTGIGNPEGNLLVEVWWPGALLEKVKDGAEKAAILMQQRSGGGFGGPPGLDLGDDNLEDEGGLDLDFDSDMDNLDDMEEEP